MAMNSPSELLSILEISNRWAQESGGRTADDLALLIIEQLVEGAFHDPQSPDEPFGTYNLDGKEQSTFEIFFDYFAQGNSGKRTSEETEYLAKNIKLSVNALLRFCHSRAFSNWAKTHGLFKPSFIYELPKETRSNTPPHRSKLNLIKLEQLYIQRVQTWPTGKKSPSREEDYRWAKNCVDDRVTHRQIRDLRSRLAPAWSKVGRPPKNLDK